MSYGHNSGYSAKESGFAVGAKGSEVVVITQSGGLYQLGSAVTATAAQINKSTLLTLADRATKIARVALGVVATGGGVFAWQNPEATDIIVTKLILDVTTKTTSACTVDIGYTATSAATLSDTSLDGLDVGTAAGLFDNVTNKGTNGLPQLKAATGKWITGSQASGAIAGIVGYAYIHYNLI